MFWASLVARVDTAQDLLWAGEVGSSVVQSSLRVCESYIYFLAPQKKFLQGLVIVLFIFYHLLIWWGEGLR